ncbi:hypothetical protein ACPWT1_07935 [Ramlibacter sp. MMS24-I3-19]|uniref:hypothetical protein n=1 Tax=Ramlibacter sp. MMS24-I3-19 TaxID=3416606 RepID=UPI003CFC0253
MADDLSRLLLLDEYGATRTNVFPSKTSMTWFLRRHRSDLIASGALLMLAGRWFVHPDKFDAYVLDEGFRAAAKRGRDHG